MDPFKHPLNKENKMKLEAKITFTMKYDVDLQYYGGVTTVEDVIAVDIKGAMDDPLEFLNVIGNSIDDNIKVAVDIIEID